MSQQMTPSPRLAEHISAAVAAESAAWETLPGRPLGSPLSEAPEHGSNRRAFLIWALMLGVVEPQRVVERVVRDVEGVQ